MEYTTKKVEVSRGIVREQEARVAQQRAKIQRAVAERHPADELQARLLIMEQSLIAMQRFLKILERDLQDELGIQQHQTRKRIEARGRDDRGVADRRGSVRRFTLEEASDRFASQATASVLSPDEGLDSLGTLAKAMRPLTR